MIKRGPGKVKVCAQASQLEDSDSSSTRLVLRPCLVNTNWPKGMTVLPSGKGEGGVRDSRNPVPAAHRLFGLVWSLPWDAQGRRGPHLLDTALCSGRHLKMLGVVSLSESFRAPFLQSWKLRLGAGKHLESSHTGWKRGVTEHLSLSELSAPRWAGNLRVSAP